MDRDPVLTGIQIQGEISNYKKYPSGHHYFSLKDQEGQIRCVMFQRDAQTLRFQPEHGMEVLAKGQVTVFPRDGTYQLYCRQLLPLGAGDLNLAFHQLKARLEEEGLFQQEYKQPLPFLPKRIALMTSPSGAVVEDMIRILQARCPLCQLFVVPVPVQGQGAGEEIASALDWVNRYQLADLILLGRGGGSLEDLWAFNEEVVARAIFASQIPLISAVGHEPDVTIADYVADRRASTPSHGAELAVPEQQKLLAQLQHTGQQLSRQLGQQIHFGKARLEQYRQSPALQNPRYLLEEKAQMLDSQQAQLCHGMKQRLSQEREHCASLAGSLHALSPMAVMGRGYAIPRSAKGKVLSSVAEVRLGEKIQLSLQDGAVSCVAEEILPQGNI